MKKVNFFAIIALALLVLSFIISGFITKDLATMMEIAMIICIIALIVSIIAIVYAGKIEKSKAPGVILLIASIIATSLYGLLFGAFNLVQDPEKNEEFCKQVVKCEKGKKDVSTCYIDGDKDKIFPVKCKDENLEEKQYK